MKNKLLYFSKLILAILCLFATINLNAQMEITPGNQAPFTPENLISNVFLGDGVEVVGITYAGDPTAVGYFQNAQADIGIERGIILSSGLATDAPGIGCAPGPCAAAGNNGVASTNTSGGGDPDLQVTANGFNINDAAVYEIDFIPIADTLEFQYVFASEEYQNYTCSGFNDAFGFYISGPGITGPFSNNAENIALVPGTTLPVTINTVNSGVATGGPATGCVSLAYSNFFVNNVGNTGLAVEYSGFTTVFTATAVVIPCQQYKIKLACGDASDSILDSAVFLEAKSFGTGSISVEATTVSIDGTLSEGCSDAVVSFTLPNPAENDIPLVYTIEGTATNGVDYTNIPNNLMIPQGSDSIGIVVSGIEDNIVEGNETFVLIVQTDNCFFDTISLTITENQLQPPVMVDTIICDGGTANLDATVPTFIPPPITFTNNNSEVIGPATPYEFPINVSGVPYDDLSPGVINSICLNILNTAFVYEVQVYLTTPGGQILELTTQNGAGFAAGGGYINTCFTETAAVDINYNPSGENFAPVSAIPFTGNWQPEGPWSDIYGGPVNGTWTLIVYDVAPGFAPTFQDWSITFNNAYFLTYDWSNSATLTCNDCAMPDATPTTNTTYTVTVTDSYGCSVTGEVDVNVISQLPPPNVSCGSSTSTSVTVVWDAVPGAVGYEINIDNAGYIPVTAGDLSYTVSGLTVGSTVSFEVVALSSDCQDSAPSTITCTAQPCTLTTSLDAFTDITCFGADDGTATLSAVGNGTINYDLGGGNINTTGLFTGLAQGSYTVSITDDDCTLTETFTINEPAVLATSLTFSNVSCNAAADGSVTVIVAGGTGGYTYAWSGGLADTDDTIDNLSGGTYTVTVTDANSCTATASQVINENTALTISSTNTDATCNGVADGTATVSVGGGSGVYDYLWDTAAADQITATATGLDVGSYVVTVTDSDACSITTSVAITAPAAMTTSTSATQASCSGSTDGTATVTASGGAGGYMYLWDNTQATSTATSLSDGWHYVTVTDINGCNAIDSAEVTVPNPIVLVISGADITCNTGIDGTASVVASGGAGGFIYNWSNAGETTDNISSIGAGDYTVTVSDVNGCTSTETINLIEPIALSISMDSTIVNCFGEATGSATATVSGGTVGYTYAWSSGGSTTDVLSNVVAGTYTVTATDANLCTIIGSIEVTESPLLASSMSVGGASCSGGGDGTATVAATGGTAPYTYLWSDSQTTATATGLMAQTYTVTVTDVLGCTTTNFINVAEPPAITVSTTGTDISCFSGTDGTVTALGNGGDGNYTYTWDNGMNGVSLSNMAASTYTVTISDGNGCTNTSSVTINEPTDIIVSDVITNVSCGGGTDGSVDITVSGGTLGYTFAWSDGSTGEDCLNVIADTYTVTITDANGCTYSDSYVITEPTPLSITLTPSDVFCFMGSDGSIDAGITGGTTPYTYSWSDGATTEDLSNITANDYTITVSDANGCSASLTTTVSQPASGVSVTMSADQTVCFGATTATATATASGGAVGYTYAWSNAATTATVNNLGGGTYTVTVTDMNNCTTSGQMIVNELSDISVLLSSTSTSCNNGNDGTATVTNISGGAGIALTDYTFSWSSTPVQTGLTATGLNAGQTYTVTITDVNGCTGINAIAIPNPSIVAVNLVNTVPVSCSGESDGSISVVGAGGTAPYTYAWSNGQTGDQVSNLTLGTYTVTVTDAGNCTATDFYGVDNPAALSVTITGVDATCKGWANGAATANVIGGVQPYSYEWSDGQTTDYIEFLAEGNYNVTVTDANNCMFAASVYIGEPDWLTMTSVVVDVTCYDDRDGSIVITAAGGTDPYMYSFDSGMTFDNTDALVGLYPGDYGLAVQDANGCTTLIDTVTVNEPLPVEVTIFNGDIVSYDLEDSIQLSVGVENNIGNPTFQWTALYGDQDMSCTDCPFPWIDGYENNRFEVVVTDANGCTGTDEIEVIVNRNREVYIPGGFTPNNDGTNDYLMVHGTSGTRVKTFRVYDRWGELVFRADGYDINSEDPTVVWDGTMKGKEMNSAVFVWYVEVRYIDGREEAFEGNTTLLR